MKSTESYYLLLAIIRRCLLYRYWTAVCLGTFVVLGAFYCKLHGRDFSDQQRRGRYLRRRDNYTGYLVETDVCKIPNIDPFDESVRKYYKKAGLLRCAGRSSLTYQDGRMLRLNRTALKVDYRDDVNSCEYQPIVRSDPNSDFRFEYQHDGSWFTTDIFVQHEFVRVFCYSRNGGIVYINFHAFVLPKPDILRKKEGQFRRRRLSGDLTEHFNVLMVGVDSASRLNFMRHMQKTRKFLLDELRAIEMTGYNKVADNTFVNIVPMTTGKYVEELPWNESLSHLPFDRYNFIWKNFSDNGYMTMYAEDAPSISIFNYLKSGFHVPPADHYNRPFAMAMEGHESVWNSNHHCVNDRLETEIYLDYLRDFAEVYKSSPLFSFIFLTRLSHDSINSLGNADRLYLGFLKEMKASGNLNNTLLFYFSDHGMRFGSYRGTYVGKLEERLPFMFLVLPTWFRSRYPALASNLAANGRRLTTPFDVYATLVDVLRFDGREREADVNDRGISLFRKIPPSRSCKTATVMPHWCTCLLQERMDAGSAFVISLANFLVEAINNMTQENRKSCASLKIGRVLGAIKLVESDRVLRFKDSFNDVIDRKVIFGERAEAIVDYQIDLETVPGSGRFESTIRRNEKDRSFAIQGSISRINKYGDQSKCINISMLKKYCYCRG